MVVSFINGGNRSTQKTTDLSLLYIWQQLDSCSIHFLNIFLKENRKGGGKNTFKEGVNKALISHSFFIQSIGKFILVVTFAAIISFISIFSNVTEIGLGRHTIVHVSTLGQTIIYWIPLGIIYHYVPHIDYLFLCCSKILIGGLYLLQILQNTNVLVYSTII